MTGTEIEGKACGVDGCDGTLVWVRPGRNRDMWMHVAICKRCKRMADPLTGAPGPDLSWCTNCGRGFKKTYHFGGNKYCDDCWHDQVAGEMASLQSELGRLSRGDDGY